MIFGLILIIVGILVLMQYFGVITGDVWPVVWGVVIIVIGLAAVIKTGNQKGWPCCGGSRKDKPQN